MSPENHGEPQVCGFFRALPAAISRTRLSFWLRHSGVAGPLALRRHLARHNAAALGMAVASGIGAALLGGLLVAGIYWFTLLGITIRRGMDAARAAEIFDGRDLVGPRFWPGVGVGAAALLVLALAARRGHWEERLRESPFYPFWALVEMLLLAPQLLLAAWGNLRALVWLGAAERRWAWALLQAVGKHERAGAPLALAAAAAELDATERSLAAVNRALFALQLTGLVTLREGRAGEGWRLTLSGEQARALCGGWTTPG